MAGQPVCHYSLQPLTLAQGACWKEAVPGLTVLKHNQGNLTFWHLKHRREKKIHGWAEFSELVCEALLSSAELCLETHLMRLPTDLYICSSCFYSLWSLPSPLDYMLLMAVNISPCMSSGYTRHWWKHVSITESNSFCQDQNFIYFQLSSLRQTSWKSEVLFD